MSVETTHRKMQVTQHVRVRIYACDGPECPVTVEVQDTMNLEETDTPEGWLILATAGPRIGRSREAPTRYFHDKGCLLDWMQP